MPARIDYFDDPNAPEPKSLVPSVNVIVTNDAGDILIIRRTDNNNWAVPGGAIDLGESIPAASIRETLEETGITWEITGLSGIYSDPRHVILYASNNEARQEFSIVPTAQATSGTPPRAMNPETPLCATRSHPDTVDGSLDANTHPALLVPTATPIHRLIIYPLQPNDSSLCMGRSHRTLADPSPVERSCRRGLPSRRLPRQWVSTVGRTGPRAGPTAQSGVRDMRLPAHAASQGLAHFIPIPYEGS